MWRQISSWHVTHYGLDYTKCIFKNVSVQNFGQMKLWVAANWYRNKMRLLTLLSYFIYVEEKMSTEVCSWNSICSSLSFWKQKWSWAGTAGKCFSFFWGGGGQKLNLRKMYSFYKLCWLITVQYYLLPRASFFQFGNPENELCSRKLGVWVT